MSGNEDVRDTPIERPLLRSDLNEIRQIVWSISERQIGERRNSLIRTLVCIGCTLVCLGCAVSGLQ